MEEALTYGGDARLGGEHLRRWRVRAPAELGWSETDDYRVWASAVETLHTVQERTAASFPVPARMTGLDVRNVRDALRLLDGEAVTVGNGDVLTIKGLHSAAGALERLTAPGRFQVAVVRQAFAYDFEGWQLPLGPCAETRVVEG
ncbi:hypothetical protein OG948_55910 (plasmid) [Embleya sp. NBC_00888]|uniref:hypothetical protein n=1 Tax=Embleya sp. NBC_00888 TaxID=2975960 RepID=UPI003868C2D2|nr:hypothetical protein OG948_55910 [Embleya sp. NBC_00888]